MRKVSIFSIDTINKNNAQLNIDHDDWIFIGYSYKKMFLLVKTLGQSELMEKFISILSVKLNAYRNNYLDYLGNVSDTNKTAWHLSETAENNTMCTNLFLDICSINVALDLLDGHDNLIVIFEKSSLIKSFKNSIKQKYGKEVKISYQRINLFNSIKNLFKNFIKYFRNLVGFLRITIYKRFVFNHHLNVLDSLQQKKELIFLHTFAHDSCFKKDGEFVERYYGTLNDSLKKEFSDLYYILHNGAATKSITEIAKWCKSSHQNFIIIEQLISFEDILISLFIPFQLLFVEIPKANMGSVEISEYVKNSLKNECYFGSIRIYYLYYCFIKNCSRKGIDIRSLLDIYEGHALESIFRFSIKKYLPNCTTIGFNHSAFSKNHLSFFTIKGGAKYRIPDVLISVSKSYRDILEREGMNPDKSFVIGNIRSDIPKDFYYNKKNIETRKTILVALPLLKNDAQELFMKVVEAFKDTVYNIKIYKHPMMHLDFLLSSIDISLPQNIKIAVEPTNVGMTKCDLVITTASTVSLNAMKIGLPVVSVKRDVGLTFEPADWFDINISYSKTPEEIREAAINLLNMNSDQWMHISVENKIVADLCLEEINENEINSFLSEIKANIN